MLLYVVGLVLVTAAVELVIAFLFSTHGAIPSQSSAFWIAYIGAVVVLLGAGGALIPRGLHRLRSPPAPGSGDERP